MSLVEATKNALKQTSEERLARRLQKQKMTMRKKRKELLDSLKFPSNQRNRLKNFHRRRHQVSQYVSKTEAFLCTPTTAACFLSSNTRSCGQTAWMPWWWRDGNRNSGLCGCNRVCCAHCHVWNVHSCQTRPGFEWNTEQR